MTHSIIREATYDDLDAVVNHMYQMHQSTSYCTTDFCLETTIASASTFIDNDEICLFVLDIGGKVEGMMIAFIAPTWWGPSLSSSDVLLYISPVYRKQNYASALVNKYVEWAKENGVQDDQIKLGITTEINVDKTASLYKSLGFEGNGLIFKYKG